MRTSTERQRTLTLQLQGLVQGVGLRPHVHRLATGLGLGGWVGNSPGGVQLELEGPEPDLQRFLQELLASPPAHCRIDRLEQQWGPARGRGRAFRIAASSGSGPASALISPDRAICTDCLAELADPGNRRHRYPFISCTSCGPRYSLLRQLPFEREHTSLAAFPACPACRREYADPADRRFHAQTISCPHCGPALQWQGEARSTDAALAAACAALARGEIVALQGVGGFQLLLDPRNAASVAELRRRKGRPDKPLALLADQRWLEQACRVSAEELALWHSAAAPILLLERRPGGPPLAAGVAGASAWLGVMRPASGLQQLLLEQWGGALVATSANRSGEPLAADARADASALAALADGVLSHGLAILNRSDDSVMRWAAAGPLVLRLGRGLAPLALPAPAAATGLALGAQLKGGLALALPEHWLLSPDLGDLSSRAGAEHLQRTLDQWLQRHQHRPAAIACDQHSGYSSSQLAAALSREAGRPLHTVQHHHAHLLSVMAEHGLGGSAIGVAWDGAGQGDDGSLWGGEALQVSAGDYRRLARLRPFPLPGGERALREPRRVALALLHTAYGSSWRQRLAPLPDLAWRQAFSAEELMLLEQGLERGVNSPLCSSAGRLFDGLAALLNLGQRCSYEAQAASALEGLAQQARAPAAGPYRLRLEPPQGDGSLWQWDWAPLLEAVLQSLSQSLPAAAIALALHQALAEAIAELAAALHTPQLLLAGGCFQNRLLLESSVAALGRRGITALWSQQLPSNDAALPIGQLLALVGASPGSCQTGTRCL